MLFQRVPHIPIVVAMITFGLLALAGPEAGGQNPGPTQGEFSRNLNDVLFDFDTHESPADLAVLHADAQWLKEHPQVRFYIEGYSDPHGEIVYNLALAQRRANGVKCCWTWESQRIASRFRQDGVSYIRFATIKLKNAGIAIGG